MIATSRMTDRPLAAPTRPYQQPPEQANAGAHTPARVLDSHPSEKGDTTKGDKGDILLFARLAAESAAARRSERKAECPLFHRMLKPGGHMFLRDVIFSFAADDTPRAVEDWIAWMLANTGYTRAEVATHIRDEHSSFAWIIEGLLDRTGFRILWSEIGGPSYADYCAETVEAV